MTISFTIPGKPSGWRLNQHVRGGKPGAHLAKNARNWQKAAVKQLKAEYKGEEPLEGPLCIRVDASFPRPGWADCSHKRACKCEPWQKDGRPLPHQTTPDATNVLKLAEDALVKAGVLRDDRFVWFSTIMTVYAPRGVAPHVRIEVVPHVEGEVEA